MRMKRLWVPVAIIAFTVNLLFRSASLRTSNSDSPEPQGKIDVSPFTFDDTDSNDDQAGARSAWQPDVVSVTDAGPHSVVPFAGAAPVEVTIRQPDQYKHPAANELMGNFEYYRELARRGDHEVSVKLNNAMRTCETIAPRSEEELAQVIDEFYQTRTLPLAAGGSIDISADEDIHELAERFAQVSRNCWQLTDGDGVEAYTWIEAAAKDDYLPALGQLMFSQLGTREEFATVKKMWELGDIHALHQLAAAYRNGRGVEADPARAHAYDYLHSHLKSLDHEIYGDEASLARSSSHLRYLEHIESRMRSYQIEEGRALAREILIANPNCCESGYRLQP